MTLTADFRTGHGAVLRQARASSPETARQAKHDATSEERVIDHRSETPIFTIFPERTARAQVELRESSRRKACLIGMCAPMSAFLALAAWYLSL